MEKVTLAAKIRKTISKAARSQTRNSGNVPGIYYAKDVSPIPVEVFENSINPLVFTAQTHLISLQLDNGQSYDCVIKEVQFDPVTDRIVHFDLLGLSATQKIELEIPVALHGSAIGVKDGGLLQQVLHKLHIECLPQDIPQHIDIDITNLKMGASIHLGDIAIEGITFLGAKDAVVVTVASPRAEKTETPEGEEASAEPEVIAKGKVEKE
jgi:large subunit ribosomal protein L25